MQASRSVVIVAWLLIVYGLLASISTLVQWSNGGGFQVNFSWLNLLFGIGLLKREEYARRLALLSIGIGIVIMIWASLAFIFSTKPANIRVLGTPVDNLPVTVALLVVSLAIGIWQFWVLTRPDVRALFQDQTVPSERKRTAKTK